MSKIRVLDQQTANSIAAGEVVERPASVVKELVENALDAEASVITIEIRQGGISLVRVTDNGCGMDPDDALQAFGRHATSKISRIEDLDSLLTMGFRGEALSSVAAVAKVRLETRPIDADHGYFVEVTAGEVTQSGAAGCPPGTTVVVENLFFNVPARFKFLRKDATEAAMITEIIERMALARPDVSMRLISGRQQILHTPGNNDLISTVYAVYGKQTAAACLPVKGDNPPLSISGLVGRPEIARNSRAQQSIFINGRLVRSRAVSAALDEASSTFFMKGKYAPAVLFISAPPQLVDVNVHPQKMEVRFWSDQEVFRLVYHAVQEALHEGAGIFAAEPDGGQAEPAEAGETAAAAPAPGTQNETSLESSDDRTGLVYPPVKATPEPPLLFKDQHDAAQPDLDTMIETSASLPPVREMTVGDLAGCHLVGQLFQTYILLESQEDLILIDQHAAHEKILYENLMSRRQEKSGHQDGRPAARAPAAPLIVPQVIELTRSEMQILQTGQEAMSQLGFSFDWFGPLSVAIREIPDSGDIRIQPEPAFRLALEALRDDAWRTPDQIVEFFSRMACHAAVKAHDRLDTLEITALLERLGQCDNPCQCPHGRPVIIRLSRHELEKRFKRIV